MLVEIHPIVCLITFLRWKTRRGTSFDIKLKRKGVDAQIVFLNSFHQGLFTIFDLQPEHTSRITQLMKQYQNLPMDLADASLVILAEHLGHGRIFSVDQRDFNSYRRKQTYPFENLLIQ
jgi:predicted nucleic acid-binding protein